LALQFVIKQNVFYIYENIMSASATQGGFNKNKYNNNTLVGEK